MKLFGISKEQQIIRLFSKGDSRAMDVLYAEYADHLTAVCARYVPREDDLHDVLQESLIKIFTKIDSFEYRGRGSLRAWLTRVVVNEALHWLRNTGQLFVVDSDIEKIELTEEEPNTALLSDDEIAALIGRLPPGYRAVFNLYAIEGKSHKEIALLLNMKPDTSASQYYKAKNMLARMIREQRKKENQQ